MPFVVAGHPTLPDTAQAIKLMSEQGADVIEVGIPFSDPIADGPVISAAMHEVLKQGEITGYDFPTIEWNEPVFVSTDKWIKGYKHANKNAERYATVQSDRIAETLKRVCPSALRKKSTEKNSSDRKRGYLLPHISVARRDFGRYLGCDIDWD